MDHKEFDFRFNTDLNNVKIRNNRAFNQLLSDFDHTAPKYMHGFADRPPLKEKFYNASLNIPRYKRVTYWRRVAACIVTLLAAVTILLLWKPENEILRSFITTYLIAIIAVVAAIVCIIIYFNHGDIDRESFICRRTIAQDLIRELDRDKRFIHEDQEYYENLRKKVEACTTGPEILEIIEKAHKNQKMHPLWNYAGEDLLMQYWKQSGLTEMRSVIDLGFAYIQRDLQRIAEERQVLAAISYS